MYYLVIDCTKKDTIHIVLVSSQQTIPAFVHTGRQVDLLRAIDTYIHQVDISISDIAGIGVVTGQGSFTSSRLAVLCANVFHYVGGMPVCSLDSSSDQSFHALQTACAHTAGYALPSYSGLPNIRL